LFVRFIFKGRTFPGLLEGHQILIIIYILLALTHCLITLKKKKIREIKGKKGNTSLKIGKSKFKRNPKQNY